VAAVPATAAEPPFAQEAAAPAAPSASSASAAEAPAPAAGATGEPESPAAPEEPIERPARRRAPARKPLLDDDPESLVAEAASELDAEPPAASRGVARQEPDEVAPAQDSSDTSGTAADRLTDVPSDDGVPAQDSGTGGAAKANRDAVALSAASSAAFAAAAAWAAAGESGSKPLPEPPAGAGSPHTAGTTGGTAAGSASGGSSSIGGQGLAGGQAPSAGQAPAAGQAAAGDQPFAAGHEPGSQPSTGQAPIGQAPAGGLLPAHPAASSIGQPSATAPAPPVAPGHPTWQAAAKPAEPVPPASAGQGTGVVAMPPGASTSTASAPWRAEPEVPASAGASGGQIPATLETGKQPLIIAASSDPPWIEQPDEAATVAWVPPVTRKGPTDTPWAEREPYRSEIEIVKPPDELGGPAPTGVICGACGTENDTTRRFCRSCGNPLFTVEAPLPEVEEPKPRSWRWLAILLPVLLVAGVLGFVGAALIRGGLFATASPSPGPIAPGPGIVLQPSGATASSTLGGLWPPRDAIDKDTTSSWREGSGRLAGEWIQVTFRQPVTILSITIWAGAQKDQDNYKGNLRPRHITIAADGGRGQTFELTDTFGSQAIAYSGPVNSTLKITIQDAYPSTKTTFTGSPTQDCAISELQFNGTMP
jgi:hypothetical protein